MQTKQEVLKGHLKDWLKTKPYSTERRTLTEQLARTLKIHHRSVGRAMRRLQLSDRSKEDHRGRPVLYTKAVDGALYEIWEAMDYPCVENMQPMIDTYIGAFVLEKEWAYNIDTEALLKGMSQSTLNDGLQPGVTKKDELADTAVRYHRH